METTVSRVLSDSPLPANQNSLKDQVTIVVPTLNEAECIGKLVDEISAAGYNEILVVDGYSKDDTSRIAEEHGAKVVNQHGKGKAGALLTAFRLVVTPYIVVMDGDGSYDPKDIDKFLPLMDEFVFVKGDRTRNENMTALHKIGNLMITKTFNLLFGTSIADICSGMYLLNTQDIRKLNFEKHPLTVEQELAAEMVLTSKKITSVPINYRKRFGGKSKTNTWRQGFRDLTTNFDLARTYNPILLFSFLSGLAIFPSVGLAIYALILYFLFHDYHSGYFIGSAILLVLGAQGLAVATIAAMLRRIERKLNSFSH